MIKKKSNKLKSDHDELDVLISAMQKKSVNDTSYKTQQVTETKMEDD